MATDVTLKELKRLMDDESIDLKPDVVNRLVLASQLYIIENQNQFHENQNEIQRNQQQLRHDVKHELDELRKDMMRQVRVIHKEIEQNPSVIKLLRVRRKLTVSVLLFLFLFPTAVFNEELRVPLIKLIKELIQLVL